MNTTYSTAEAARIAGTSERAIRRWIESARLKATRMRKTGRGSAPWQIRHDDLMAAMRGDGMLIPFTDGPTHLDSPESRTRDAMSLMVTWPLERRQEPFSLELFSGFSRLRAVTYTVSIPMIYRLLSTFDFDDFEVIFGNDRLLTADVTDVFGLQMAIKGQLYNGWAGLEEMESPRSQEVADRVAAGSVKFRVMHDKVAHSKIYLLDGGRRRRLILGSANMSETAFSGRQAEAMLCFDDDSYMWGKFHRTYQDLHILASDTIDQDCLTVRPATIVPVDDTPVMRRILEEKDPVTLYVPATDMDNPGNVERLGAIISSAAEHANLALNGHIKPNRAGALTITPQDAAGIRKNAAVVKPAKTSRPVHQLVYERGQFFYDDRLLERPSDDDEQLFQDSYLLTKYINNYAEFEDGGDNLQRDYFAVMAWIYFTPFMPRMKAAKRTLGPGNFDAKQVALIYGESNCGKTDVVNLLYSSMFEPPPPLKDADLTVKDVKNLQALAALYPLFYDDVKKSRFQDSGLGTAIVKGYDDVGASFGRSYPCLIASLNSEAKEFPVEVRKRAMLVYAGSPLPLDNIELGKRMEESAQRIHNQIGTSFFREYLYRMEAELPTDAGELASMDFLLESSTMLMNLFREYLRDGETMPKWCARRSLDDFNEAMWDSKRDMLSAQVAQDRYSKESPPAVGRWTMSGQDIVIGVSAMQRRSEVDKFPSYIVNHIATTGETIYLRAGRTVDFMQRSGRCWEIPIPTSNPLRKLARMVGRTK